MGCKKTKNITFCGQLILIAQFHCAKNCCVGSVNQIKNLDGTLSGIPLCETDCC